MTRDPAGHYAALDVDAAAPLEAITAAYRRKARVLHPDVPGSGNAEAFMRVKAAYDVVGDAERRARYDRTARAAPVAPPPAPPPPPPAVPRGPQLSNLPIAVWALLGGTFCVAAVMAVLEFSRPAPPRQASTIRPFAPPAAAPRPPVQPRAPAALATGPTTHFVLPTGNDPTLWRRDPSREGLVPAGHIASFSPVQVLGLEPQHGLAEIALANNTSAFIDATRLAPGDRVAARRAYCAYNSGPPPQNGEVLRRGNDGTARIEISNRTSQSAVVKLRDGSGRTAAAVFVAPGATTMVVNLPDTAYRPDFALGELWSRACNEFAAGMRAQRFAGYASPAGLSPLVIPPDLSVGPAPVDISDSAFGRD